MKFDFKPKTTIAKEHSKPVLAKVIAGDKVLFLKKEYPIAVKSQSVNGCTIMYKHNDNLKMMPNRKYNCENPNYRPYRPNLKVTGVINDNQEFVIHSVKHAHEL